MGMRAARMCKKCFNTAVPGTSLCPKHSNADKERDAAYKSDNPLRPLYWTKRWKVVRRHVIARDPICTHEENGARCPRLSTDAHHVIPAQKFVNDRGDFFDMSNLAGLCKEHHSRETAKEVGFAGWQTRACRKPCGKVSWSSAASEKRN
jgi:hypothetical protein